MNRSQHQTEEEKKKTDVKPESAFSLGQYGLNQMLGDNSICKIFIAVRFKLFSDGSKL